MKIINTISVGDLHGLNVWEKIIPDYYDKIIFIGDYVDSFDISPVEQIHNLKNVIEFKKANLDKVILLYGNHDVHYSHFPDYRCSGFQGANYFDYMKLYLDNKNLFQLTYQLQYTLWSHAGIHTGWYNKYIKRDFLNQSELNLSQFLNLEFNKNKHYIFEVGYSRGGRLCNVGGPLWLDRSLIWKKPIKNYHQIVGHTRITDGKGFKYIHHKKINSSVTCIDILEDEEPKFYTKQFEFEPIS